MLRLAPICLRTVPQSRQLLATSLRIEGIEVTTLEPTEKP
jgi:hypothetical protein